jgi:hypothetical protein
MEREWDVISFAELHKRFRLYGFVAGAAFGVEEAEQFLERGGIGGAAEEGAFAGDTHQFLVLQFVEVVGEVGGGDSELVLNLADHHSIRVRGEQQLHDAKPRVVVQFELNGNQTTKRA